MAYERKKAPIKPKSKIETIISDNLWKILTDLGTNLIDNRLYIIRYPTGTIELSYTEPAILGGSLSADRAKAEIRQWVHSKLFIDENEAIIVYMNEDELSLTLEHNLEMPPSEILLSYQRIPIFQTTIKLYIAREYPN